MTSAPQPSCGCPDFSVTRRSLLKGASALGGSFAVAQMFGDSMLQATFADGSGGNVLVVISLRGGIDGLGVVVPHGDPGYYSARPTTAVPRASVLCADSMFGLHPKMAPLQKYWQSGELAAVQAAGLPVANRSHFAAIEVVEEAAPGSSTRSGWINRMIGQSDVATSFDAVQMGLQNPTAAVSGDAPVIATADLSQLQMSALPGFASQRNASLSQMWSDASGPLAKGADEAFSISKGKGQQLATMADSATVYPSAYNASPFAAPLRGAAKLIRADVGTEVIAIDAGMWDMHTGYGDLSSGSMQSNVDGFAQSLAAFLDDLGAARQRVTVVTISEFGRRVAENGSRGFDHGWGNMMLVAGAGVKGGSYYGTWPGLGSSALSDGDLKVTTDYRTVLSEIISRRFPDRSLPQLFPGFSYSRLGFMN